MSVEAEAVRAEVERLLRSRTFETSEVHRRLLLYLVEKTLAGEADRLKEYTIGLEAFGKPPSYDPKHDSIVRLQVGRLRQKLLAYYQTEATGDSVVLGLPKGGFKLTFAPAGAPKGVSAPWDPQRKVKILALALILVGIWAVVATVGALVFHRETRITAERWTPELQGLWAPFLQSPRPLLVCLGTPLFIRIPEYGFFRDPKANDWQEIENSERVAAVRRGTGGREILPLYNFTGAGEASAAFLIAKLLSTRKREILLTRSNLLSWQQVADHDMVFVGPPKFNLQLQATPLARDIAVEPEGIRNLRPKPGEPVFLPDRMSPNKPSEGETHALISRTPGLSGVGELLVIAGNASSDTLAAAEWLTQPWHARELAQYLRGSSGELPRYYEAVIKVTFRQGIPVQTSYVFHHVLK